MTLEESPKRKTNNSSVHLQSCTFLCVKKNELFSHDIRRTEHHEFTPNPQPSIYPWVIFFMFLTWVWEGTLILEKYIDIKAL